MTALRSVLLESADPEAATRFYRAFLGSRVPVRVRRGDAATSGFRGFTMSLVVSQPGNVNLLHQAALDAGATALKPAAKSMWGYGGTIQAPDGAIWKIASSSKHNTAPATRDVDDVVLLLGCADVKASRQFYVGQGLQVEKSYGSKYVQFEKGKGAVTLGLYGRKALAKDAGVAKDGSGSHRLVMVGDRGGFADPDGFGWEAAR